MAKSGKKWQKVKRKVTKSGTSGKKWSEKWQKVAKTEAKSGKKWQPLFFLSHFRAVTLYYASYGEKLLKVNESNWKWLKLTHIHWKLETTPFRGEVESLSATFGNFQWFSVTFSVLARPDFVVMKFIFWDAAKYSVNQMYLLFSDSPNQKTPV